MSSPPGTTVQVDGKPVLYFAGTAYFALQGDPRVIEAACSASRQYGIHPATSRGGYGETLLLRSVEKRAATFFAADDALYFAAGYAGPALLMQAAEQRFDLVAMDESVHLASQDAVDQHGAKVVRFRHLDPQHLEDVLSQHRSAQRIAVMCDGVSPVLGDIAPASQYLEVLKRAGGGILVVDDCHGVGVLGANGRGTLEHAADVSSKPILVNTHSNSSPRESLDRSAWMCGTMSKALGGGGGIIAGSDAFIAGLKTRARWYHGAAAPAAPVAGATDQALQILIDSPEMRERLRANIVRMRSGLARLGLQVESWPTPIVCVKVGDGANMERIQRTMFDRGIAIAHSRNYPGVGEEGALRVAVFSTHTDEMIDRLLGEMASML